MSAPEARENHEELDDAATEALANGDTTGGNSGSPVVNGRGELVGFNFDRVWENIAGDFGYNPARSRNIIVDVRYLLWLLDKVVDGHHLLKELGLGDLIGRARRTPQPTPPPGWLSSANASTTPGGAARASR